MNKQPKWSLLAKYLSDECSDSEINAVNHWLEADEKNKKILESYKNIWELKEPESATSDVNALWEKINERISARVKTDKHLTDIYETDKKKSAGPLIYKLVQYPVLRYAAVLFIIVSVSVLYYLITNQGNIVNARNWKIVTVENGKQLDFTLSDGTKLIMDAGSRLQYPETFNADFREIKFEGEAYLEVQHDESRPFKIQANNALVEVLGTKFNVRNWKESRKVEVAVVEGKVALENSKMKGNRIILPKGFAGELSPDGKLNGPDQVKIDSYISWMKGEISFDDASLAEVLAQVERWYNVNVSLRDSTVLKERLSVFVDKKSLTNVLDLLTKLTNTNYKISGNNILLNPNQAQN